MLFAIEPNLLNIFVKNQHYLSTMHRDFHATGLLGARGKNENKFCFSKKVFFFKKIFFHKSKFFSKKKAFFPKNIFFYKKRFFSKKKFFSFKWQSFFK